MKAFLTALCFAIVLLFQPTTVQAEVTHTQRALERWIFTQVKSGVSPSTAKRIVKASYKQAEKHGISPFLILSTIRTESRFVPTARNKSGAMGLMQIIPFWHRDKIAGRDILNIETNIEVGTKVLADCIAKYNGSIDKSLRCYSGGAKRYESLLRTGHKEIVKAETLYRFEHDLPAVDSQRFDKLFRYSLSDIKEEDNEIDLVAAN